MARKHGTEFMPKRQVLGFLDWPLWSTNKNSFEIYSNTTFQSFFDLLCNLFRFRAKTSSLDAKWLPVQDFFLKVKIDSQVNIGPGMSKKKSISIETV